MFHSPFGVYLLGYWDVGQHYLGGNGGFFSTPTLEGHLNEFVGNLYEIGSFSLPILGTDNLGGS